MALNTLEASGPSRTLRILRKMLENIHIGQASTARAPQQGRREVRSQNPKQNRDD